MSIQASQINSSNILVSPIKPPSVYRGVNHYRNPITLEDNFEYTSRTYDRPGPAKGMATRMRTNHRRRRYDGLGNLIEGAYWYRSKISGRAEEVELVDSWVEEAPTIWRRV